MSLRPCLTPSSMQYSDIYIPHPHHTHTPHPHTTHPHTLLHLPLLSLSLLTRLSDRN
ncbi:BBF_collapsed_G0013940.mRNA.1.CDS.1 [Saccharomyces cerevisiae]|nr:BBF_HP1_G0013790.mRNA.1.CDS.1 [Saccharomyces cerevisiae]CAI7095657.1 BBF_collapsed_G0013940.mRNA.1.CDS.1 [Saccharomyces cerevisiae]